MKNEWIVRQYKLTVNYIVILHLSRDVLFNILHAYISVITLSVEIQRLYISCLNNSIYD